MTVGELIGHLNMAMGRGEITLKSNVSVEAANEDTFQIADLNTDKDEDDVSLVLAPR